MATLPLSALERSVLVGWIQGTAYRDMAAQMGITYKAVDNALQRVVRKFEGVRP